MVNVNKKYVKIAVGGLAVSALVIGLSVGLTAKNKNNSNVSASNASENALADFDENAAIQCIEQTTDGTTLAPKAGKSGPAPGRRLLVPGTEEYVAHVSGKGDQLRKDLSRRLNDPARPKSQRTRLAKSAKMSKAPKTSKAPKANMDGITACTTADLCNGGTANDSANGKLGGKSGRRKLSGKSGGEAETADINFCGGEIGGIVGGKSGGRRKLSGKSGANVDGIIDGIDENCISPNPTICDTTSPAPSAFTPATKPPKTTTPLTTKPPQTPPPIALLETPEPTPAPTVPCDCSVEQWISFNGQCYHGCGFSCETLPTLYSALTSTCNEGFENSESCCGSLGLDAGVTGEGGCIAIDLCPPLDVIETPAPSPALTAGSTPTVSADVTGPPTTKDRPTTGSPESV